MKRIDTELQGACILEPVVYRDARGFFMETFNQKTLEGLGIKRTWVQGNHSKSAKGVLRGLHWQIGNPQAKLVRVVEGAAFDVAVDLRRKSPTFGRWTGVELSAENKQIFFVPEGFAHGFLVMTETAEFLYKCSDYYAPESERGLIWNDPTVGIRWPTQGTPLLSKRDAALGTLDQLPVADLF